MMFAHVGLRSQSPVVKLNIMGYNNSLNDQKIVAPETYFIDVTFKENNNKCDPEIGYITLEEKEYDFEKDLIASGIAFDRSNIRTELKDLADKNRSSTYRHTSTDLDELHKVYDLAIANFADAYEVNAIFRAHSFEQEDDKAVSALKHAMHKAKTIAKGLAKDNVEVVGIDDLTSVSVMALPSPRSTRNDQKEVIGISSRNGGIVQPLYERYSTYSLRVLFELY